MDFRPIDLRTVAWHRRALLPVMQPVGRALRAVWRRSGHSRSTWFDSRLWRAIWNVNRWFACTPRADPTRVEVQFAPRIRMELDLARLTDVLAFCYGPGEGEIGWFCAERCPADGVVLDVGGNIGTTALSFAATLPRGTVHVFEPAAGMLAALRRNVALSRADNVVVHPYGLSDVAERGCLQVPIAGNPGSAFLAGHGRAVDPAAEDVEVRRLDDAMCDLERVDFVKIDVEGHELHVLRGGRELLARHRPALVVELNEAALQRAGASGREVCAFLLDLGYRLQYLDRGRLRDYDVESMLRRRLHNLIALPA